MVTVLTIAGSDPSGGAGIQADIKTIEAHGAYGMSAITALTAQNTKGITGKLKVSGEFVRKQIMAVFDDIFPDAVKIGMLPDIAVMQVVKDILLAYRPKNIVFDPVLGSTSGTAFLDDEARAFMEEELFPLCTLITPNIPESEVFTTLSIKSEEDMEKAAKQLGDTYGCSVLIKGGHSIFNTESSKDCLYSDMAFFWYETARINNPNTHGTGCTLSSAIACNLAWGQSLNESIRNAKEYLTRCIEAGLDLGKGRGPLEHRVKMSAQQI